MTLHLVPVDQWQSDTGRVHGPPVHCAGSLVSVSLVPVSHHVEIYGCICNTFIDFIRRDYLQLSAESQWNTAIRIAKFVYSVGVCQVWLYDGPALMGKSQSPVSDDTDLYHHWRSGKVKTDGTMKKREKWKPFRGRQLLSTRSTRYWELVEAGNYTVMKTGTIIRYEFFEMRLAPIPKDMCVYEVGRQCCITKK